MRKRILLFTNTIPDYRRKLYSCIAQKHELTVVVSEPIHCQGEPYHVIVMPTYKVGPLYFQSGLGDIINRITPDKIVVMFDVRWVSVMLLPLLYRNYEYISWGYRRSKKKFVENIKSPFLALYNKHIVYSEGEGKSLIDRIGDNNHVVVANNTIEVLNYSDHSSSQKDSFIFVGRLQQRKNIDMLLRSYSRLVQTEAGQGILLNIVGSGEEEDWLKALAKQEGIHESVKFWGTITDHITLEKLYSRAYAYVSPGAVGLGVLHSFAYGVPVVTNSEAYHGPEYENLVHYENALIYSDEAGLYPLMLKLVEDKEFAASLGTNAFRHYADGRLMEHMCERMCSTFE